MYGRDIDRLREAYGINQSKNGTNDSLNAKALSIRQKESAAYEANNIGEIEEAVDKLDDDLRPRRDDLGEAILAQIAKAEKRKADLEAQDAHYHEQERQKSKQEE